jgi:hypothetical protein
MVEGGSTTRSASGRPAFEWKDHGRFVELHPVQTGWLVLWGRYEDLGRRRVLLGNRTYPGLDGARRRVADAAAELTGRPALAADAVAALDRTALPPHTPEPLPEPL